MNRNIILPIFAVSGATALIYEILWIRPLSLVFGNSMYAIGTIIFSFIIGLAIGSFLIARYADRIQNPLRTFAFLQIGVGLSSIVLLSVINELPNAYVSLFELTRNNFEVFVILQVVLSSLILLVPATLIGMSFPLVMKYYSNNLGDLGKDVGKIDGVNSLGAAIGVLLVSFFLMSELGIKMTVQLIASINLGIGIAIFIFTRSIKKKQIAIITSAAILTVIGAADYDVANLNSAVFAIKNNLNGEITPNVLDGEILYHKDSFYQSVVVVDQFGFKTLKLNGLPQCNTSDRVNTGLLNMPTIPLKIMQDKDVKILNIGHGCGTITHFLNERNYDVTTLEIDQNVVDASEIIYPGIDNSNVIVDDARNYLLRNSEKYDLIVTEPNQPYGNNIGNLYTIEFFTLMKDRLNEDGLVSQYFPMWALDEKQQKIFVNTFQNVFSYTYIFEMEEGSIAQLILIGSDKDLKLDQENIILPDSTLINTDDKPMVEFTSAWQLMRLGS